MDQYQYSYPGNLIAVLVLFIGALFFASPTHAATKEINRITSEPVRVAPTTELAHYVRYYRYRPYYRVYYRPYYRPYYRYHYYRPYYKPYYYNRYYYRW